MLSTLTFYAISRGPRPVQNNPAATFKSETLVRLKVIGRKKLKTVPSPTSLPRHMHFSAFSEKVLFPATPSVLP